MGNESISYKQREIYASRTEVELMLRFIALNLPSAPEWVWNLKTKWLKISQDFECYSVDLSCLKEDRNREKVLSKTAHKILSELETGGTHLSAETLRLLGLTDVAFIKDYPKENLRRVLKDFINLLQVDSAS